MVTESLVIIIQHLLRLVTCYAFTTFSSQVCLGLKFYWNIWPRASTPFSTIHYTLHTPTFTFGYLQLSTLIFVLFSFTPSSYLLLQYAYVEHYCVDLSFCIVYTLSTSPSIQDTPKEIIYFLLVLYLCFLGQKY